MESPAKKLLYPDDEESSHMRKSDSFVKSLSRRSSFGSVMGEVPPLGRSITSFVRSMKRPYDPVQIDYFTSDKSFKERLQTYFVDNQRSSFYIRLFNFLIKLLSCVLYCVRVIYDEGTLPADVIAHRKNNYTDDPKEIKFEYLLWVDRHPLIWTCQTAVGIVSLVETILIFYISYKGNVLRLLVTWSFLLELVTSVPLIVTIFVPPWREVFIPVFLNCWLAKIALQAMLNDMNRSTQKQQSALSQQMIILGATLLCLLFTGTCGIQHLQRSGIRKLDLFQSFYFVVVTFATVGYGDLYPDYWMSQLYVVVMISVAIALLPSQIETLGHTYVEKQKTGGEYGKRRAKYERHVVVTVTYLRAEVIIDFLNEFYAHTKLQDYYVILLSPGELDNAMRILLQVPLWTERVIYIRGSALKDADLERARMAEADSCFILSARNNPNKIAADEHTILRSWAVRDFAPKCQQYVQIFRPETKMHVRHAEYVICEDEFKFSLLANNCICPGISTFITLLMHTSRGEEGQKSSEPWHQLYGHHSGNEIYHILLGVSKFFGEYEGKSFTYASFHANRKYGVSLVGVQKSSLGSTIQLNPGHYHTMQKSDICYYIALTKEEQSSVRTAGHSQQSNPKVANTIASIGTLALEMQHTRTQPTNKQALSQYPKLKGQLKKKNVKNKKGKQAGVEEEDTALMLEVNSMTRRRSIDAVPDCLEASRHGSDNEEDHPNQSRKCEKCADVCIEEMWVQCSVVSEPDYLLLGDQLVPMVMSSFPCKRAYHLVGSIPKQHWFNASSVPFDDERCSLIREFPPVTPYIGTSATLCHMHKTKRAVCCMQLSQPCEHCEFKTANDYKWANPAIIVAADHASSALYNFVIPLRAHYRPVHEINPIVLLLEQKPQDYFLDSISWFPLVYWMRGTISNLDNLLRSGIYLADHLVLVKEGFTSDEEHLADCNTIVTVQTIHRLFPSLHVITELTHSSNMRFMQFNAKDAYALQQSKFEKQEKERGSHMAYMFRLPFASGRVFSANMLDTLLYQAFVKDYLVQFVRLLLGIDQAVGSGYLSSFQLSEEDMWIRTYGRLYQKLCSSDADIPIGIFRTKPMDSTTISLEMEQLQSHQTPEMKITDENLLHRRFNSKYFCSERAEISSLIKNRMNFLELPSDDYVYSNETRGKVSFVIINPSFDLKLEPGDIIYVIKPPSTQGVPGLKTHPRRGMRPKRDASGPLSPIASMSQSQSTSQLTKKLDTGNAPIAKVDSANSVLDDVPTVLINNGRGEAQSTAQIINLRTDIGN